MVRWVLTISAILLLGLCRGSFAQDAAQASSDDPPITKIDDNVFRIGKLVVDGNKHEVTLGGWVNMSEGMIELLACAPGGKQHESVLVFDVEPFHLQIALLLLGLQFGGTLQYQGDPATPCGDSVDIFVEWNDPSTGEHVLVRGEDLVATVPSGRPMPHTEWIFAGSRVVNGIFMAQSDKSLVTTYHDPNTILDNPLPEGADDTAYAVNSALVPAEGTKIKVTIKPYRIMTGGDGSN